MTISRYVISSILAKKNLELQYYKVFLRANKPLEFQGLGVIAKYLTYGNIETVEFLSLDFFMNDGRVKIVRQMPRLLCNDGWSRKAATNLNKAHYIAKAMLDSVEAWP